MSIVRTNIWFFNFLLDSYYQNFEEPNDKNVTQYLSIQIVIGVATYLATSVFLSMYEAILDSLYISNAIDRELSQVCQPP